MFAVIQRLQALTPSREQLEANPWLRGLAPYLANPKLWHWSRRGVAAGDGNTCAGSLLIRRSRQHLGKPGNDWPTAVTGLGITASVAAIASYLLISRTWIWHVSAKRRAGRP